MSYLRYCCPLMLAGMLGYLSAEAPGIPYATQPGGPKPFTVDMWNDMFALAGGANPDDHRSQTLSLTGTLPLGRWWGRPSNERSFDDVEFALVGGLDHSILTERGFTHYAIDGDPEWPYAPPAGAVPDPFLDPAADPIEGRVDQLTVAVGLMAHRVWPMTWWDRGDDGGRLHTTAAAGISYRHLDDLHGDTIQNNWHEAIHRPVVPVPYTATVEQELGTWLSTSATLTLPVSDWNLSAGVWSNAVGHVVTDGTTETSLRLNLFLDHPYAGVWAGIRAEGRTGYDHDTVLRQAGHADEGLYWMFGVRILPWIVLEAGRNTTTGYAFGRAGIVTATLTDLETDGKQHLDFRASAMLPAFSRDLSLRYHHDDLTWHGWRPAAIIGWREGQAPSRDISPNPSDLDDPLKVYSIARHIYAGIDLQHIEPLLHMDWVRFFAAGHLGWRKEQFEDRKSRHIDDTDVDDIVLGIDSGVRIGFYNNQFLEAGVSLALSAWLPLGGKQRVSYAGETVGLMRAAVAFNGGLDLRFRF